MTTSRHNKYVSTTDWFSSLSDETTAVTSEKTASVGGYYGGGSGGGTGGGTVTPGITEIPIDNQTIVWNNDVLTVPIDNDKIIIDDNGKLTVSSVTEDPTWENVKNKPDWLIDNKISYSEIEGVPDLSNFITKDYVDENVVTITGTQSIIGEKNFKGVFKINDQPIVYNSENGYWKLDGDLIVTGGITMYGDSVSGGSAGATTLGQLQNVGTWADSVADVDRIMYQAAGSSMWVAKSLSSIGGGGSQDVLITGGGLIDANSLSGLNGLRYYASISYDSANLPITAGYQNALIDIALHDSASSAAQLYVSLGSDLYFRSRRTDSWKTIIDSSNYSSYALPLSGGTVNGNLTISSSSWGNQLTIHRSQANSDAVIGFSNKGDGIIGYIGIGGSLSASAKLQPYFSNGTSAYTLWHSGNDGSGSGLDADLLDGKHLSAILASNVASATKLQTARTIWGQSFDGTGGIDGKLILNNNIELCGKATDGTAMSVLKITTNNNLTIGLDTSAKGYATYISGNNIYLRYGTSRTNGIILNSYGNITIGSSDFAGTSAKLHVVGESLLSQSANGSLYYRVKGVNYELGFGLGSAGVNRGIYDWTNNSWMIYRDSSTNVLIPQGNVGIGTTSPTSLLHVNGDGRITDVYFRGSYINLNRDGATGKAYNYTKTALEMEAAVDFSIIRTYNVDVQTVISLHKNGCVGIGTTSPSYKLHVNGTFFSRALHIRRYSDGASAFHIDNESGTNGYIISADGVNGYLSFRVNKSGGATEKMKLDYDGNLLVYGGLTFYSQRSLKNVIDERGLSLNELSIIKPTRYTWKDGRDDRLHFGGIADDIQQVLPEVVYKTGDNVLTMDYGNAAFAIASSLIKPVVDHEQRIVMLEQENRQLRQEIERLKCA